MPDAQGSHLSRFHARQNSFTETPFDSSKPASLQDPHSLVSPDRNIITFKYQVARMTAVSSTWVMSSYVVNVSKCSSSS